VPDFDDPDRGLFYAKLFSLANDMHPAMKRYGFDPPLSLLGEFPAVRACHELLAARPRIGDMLRRTETMMAHYLAARNDR
jgi:hypothetical protein